MRRRGLVRCVIVLVCCSACPICPAGEAAQYGLDFLKRDTDLTWTHTLSGFDYTVGKTASGEPIRISGGTNVVWNLIQGTGSGQDRWITRSGANLAISYPVSRRTRIGVSTNMNKSRDSGSQYADAIVNQSVSSTLSLKPFFSGRFRSLSFNQSTGQSLDRRLGQRFSGIGYSFGTSLSPELVGGLSNSFSYSKSGNTSRRGDLNSSVAALAGYTVSRLSTRASYSENRGRQNYVNPASKTDTRLEERFSRSRSFGGGAELPGSLSGSFSYSESKTSDTISDDPGSSRRGTDSRDRSLTSSVNGSFKPFGSLAFSAKVDYGTTRKSTMANNQGFRRDDLDRRSGNLSVTSSLSMPFSEKQSFTLSGSTGLSRDDTPSPLETTDKDNLSRQFRASYSGSFAGEAQFSSSMSVTQGHLVFRNAANSANNRWNKDYILDARTSYKLGGKADLSHSYSVAVYRIAYDYDEDYFTNRTIPRSNVRRRWSMQHSLGSSIVEGLQCRGNYSLWLEDFGSLFSDGRSMVVEDKVQHSATVSMSYAPAAWLSLNPSATYQFRKEWDRKYAGGRETRKLTDRSTFKTFSLSATFNARQGSTVSLKVVRTGRRSLLRPPSSDDTVFAHYEKNL